MISGRAHLLFLYSTKISLLIIAGGASRAGKPEIGGLPFPSEYSAMKEIGKKGKKTTLGVIIHPALLREEAMRHIAQPPNTKMCRWYSVWFRGIACRSTQSLIIAAMHKNPRQSLHSRTGLGWVELIAEHCFFIRLNSMLNDWQSLCRSLKGRLKASTAKPTSFYRCVV